jgi:hypothetical protein
MFPPEGWGQSSAPPAAAAGSTFFPDGAWARHYFAPHYWSGESGVALPTGSGAAAPGASYFPRRDWPPRYFAPRFWSGTSVDQTALGRDRDIFRAIKAALDATNSFATVLLHQSVLNARAGADQNPIVTIQRTAVQENSRWGNPITIERTVSFDLTIAIRAEDHDERFEQMELLESVVMNVLSGQSWAGICLPDRSLIARGMDDPRPRHPEQRVVMKGQFTYLLGYATRNTD